MEDYKYGREINVCIMDKPSVTEDGIQLQPLELKSKPVEFGNPGVVPLNLYGDDSYKKFPEIGDVLRPED